MALAVLAVLSLAGCGGGASIASLSNSQILSGRIFGGGPTKMGIAPIVGAPQNIADELSQALVVAGKQHGLTLTPGNVAGAYALRGYLVAKPDRKGATISYIWDVADAKGQRVTRVSGDEAIAQRKGSDPWSGVDSLAIGRIAADTASRLSASLKGGSAPPPPVASTETGGGTAAVTRPPGGTGTAAARPAPVSGPVMALVSPVSGAPGDGQKTLTAAIKQRLGAGGVPLTSSAGGNVYTVKGTVILKDAGGGKQSVRIDWQVLNPNGSKRGTVSQQNVVAKGMLDGPWGAIADAAAADAAKGIIKLLPPH
jgi:hypothetical protein